MGPDLNPAAPRRLIDNPEKDLWMPYEASTQAKSTWVVRFAAGVCLDREQLETIRHSESRRRWCQAKFASTHANGDDN
jgi:hypothetical protein